MKFSIRFADQIVGVLVILALAILVVVIFMLGRTQRWFSHDYQYVTYFNSASGLSPNMAVQYKGFKVGYVKKFTLENDDSVKVIFTIFEENSHKVREGSVVELQASPIGLGNAFLFYPGNGKTELPEGSIIPEISSLQAKQMISSGLASAPEANDSINNIINQVNMLLETINVSLAGSNGADELALGQIIGGINNTVKTVSGDVEPIMSDVRKVVTELTEQLAPVIANLETLSVKIASPDGAIMSMLDAKGPVFTNIAEVLDSISGTMKSVEKTVEFIPSQLPQIAILLSNLHSALTEAEKLIIALNNNPLLKGGVPVPSETGPGAGTPRDLDF